jgi:2-oxoglutarate ferredoxin oxidoreductase subunit alpha
MQKKRMAKLDNLKSQVNEPDYYGVKDAELLLVCWGSSFGACIEAVNKLNEKGRKAATLHYSQVWPLNIGPINKLLKENARIIVVENNYAGQFRSILFEHGIKSECELVSRYDGLPFTAEYIIEELKL